jgi:hypothetical protein
MTSKGMASNELERMSKDFWGVMNLPGVISGFRRGVSQISALLGFYAV